MTIITNKDSIVPLPKNVAKAVVKDIIRNDSLQAELKIANTNIDLFKKNIIYYDSVVTNKDNQINLYKLKDTNYETMLILKDTQKKNLENLTTQLTSDLKKAKRQLKFRTGIGVAIIGGLTYLLLKK